MVADRERRLPGGNVGGAWRIGHTVRRTTGPWTPAVHALLTYLAPRLAHIPNVLGFDERDREILTFLPGRVLDINTDVLTTGQLRSIVTWTRRFHHAVAGFTNPGPWRFPAVDAPILIAHNDIAPYNVCFDGDDLAGVFDWDLAAPSTPLLELAFIAWNCVPLWRGLNPQHAANRLHLIASTYGTHPALDILYAVPTRIDMMLDWIPTAAAAGDHGARNLLAVGEPERSQRALNNLHARIPAIAAHLH